MFYAKSTGGFYTTEIHGDNIPSDAVVITEATHQSLLAGQSSGQVISADATGKPILVSFASLMTLDQTKVTQIATLTNAYNNAIQQPINYMSTTFQADSASQDTLNKVLVALSGTVPTGFYWMDSTNNKVSMTFAQLQGLAGAMMAQGWTAFQHLQAQKSLVNAATTATAVSAINW